MARGHFANSFNPEGLKNDKNVRRVSLFEACRKSLKYESFQKFKFLEKLYYGFIILIENTIKNARHLHGNGFKFVKLNFKKTICPKFYVQIRISAISP